MNSAIIVSVVLVIAFLIALTTGVEHSVECNASNEGRFFNHPKSCSAFFVCFNGVLTEGSCPGPYYFNYYDQKCDWPENVNCWVTTTATETTATEPPCTTWAESTEVPTTDEPIETTRVSEDETTLNAQSECYGLNNGVLVGIGDDCRAFSHCVDNLAFPNRCPFGLLFNGVYCDLAERVICGEETTTEIVSVPTTELPETTSVSQSICFGEPDNTFLNNPYSCAAFFSCYGNEETVGFCAEPFFFNPITTNCDWPENVDCSDDPPSTEIPTTEAPETEESTTEESETEECSTELPETEKPSTEGSETGTPTTEAPDTEEPTTEAPDTQEPSTEAPETEEPSTEATSPPTVCLPDQIGLVPHPTKCSLFYLCVLGEQFEHECDPGKHFSKEVLACVPRELANCRLEDPFCDPEESETRAINLPHPHFCEKFFVCFRGELFSLSCSNGEHWDPVNSWCVHESESTCVA